MNPTTHSILGYPEWLYQLERKLQDFTPSFPDVLDEVVFEQLNADALMFRRLLTSKERLWILDRLHQSMASLMDWQQKSRLGNASSLKALSLLPPPDSVAGADAVYGIASRLIQLSVRMLEHPNYIPAIGEDIGIIGRSAFLPAA